jgi:TonB family protein
MERRDLVPATLRRGTIPALLLCLLGWSTGWVPAGWAVGRTEGLPSSESEGQSALTELAQIPEDSSPSPPRNARQVVRAEGDELSDGLRDRALGALDELPEADRSPDGLLGLAMLRYGRGEYAGAAAAADAVLERVPSGPLAVTAATVAGYSLFYRSTVNRDLLEQSLERVDRALALSEGTAQLAAYGKILVLWALDRPGSAIHLAESVMATAPSSPPSDRARRLLCTIQDNTPAEELVADGFSPEENLGPSPEQKAILDEDPDAVVAPEKIYSPAPLYTEVARQARVQGAVVLQAVIDRHGCPTSIEVLEGLPHGLDEKAVEAVRTWVFRPATVAGEPLPVYYRLKVNFKLE